MGAGGLEEGGLLGRVEELGVKKRPEVGVGELRAEHVADIVHRVLVSYVPIIPIHNINYVAICNNT